MGREFFSMELLILNQHTIQQVHTQKDWHPWQLSANWREELSSRTAEKKATNSMTPRLGENSGCAGWETPELCCTRPKSLTVEVWTGVVHNRVSKEATMRSKTLMQNCINAVHSEIQRRKRRCSFCSFHWGERSWLHRWPELVLDTPNKAMAEGLIFEDLVSILSLPATRSW